jgi:hypothetical protein
MLSKALEMGVCFHRGAMKRAALSIGALLENLEGGSFTGTFERKRECISGFLFLGRRGP